MLSGQLQTAVTAAAKRSFVHIVEKGGKKPGCFVPGALCQQGEPTQCLHHTWGKEILKALDSGSGDTKIPQTRDTESLDACG